MAEEKNVGYADMTVADPSECEVVDTHLCFSNGRFYVNKIHVNDFPTRIDVTEQVAKAIAQYLTPLHPANPLTGETTIKNSQQR